MFDKLAEYRKAIAAFATPGIIIIIASLTPASDGGSTITISEWLYVILAILGTGTIVAAVPNALTTQQKAPIIRDAIRAFETPAPDDYRTKTEQLADRSASRSRLGLPD